MNQQTPSHAVSLANIQEAADRIAPHVIRTPLLESPRLNDWLGFRLLVKCENLQVLAFHQQPEPQPVVQSRGFQKRRSDHMRGDPVSSFLNVGEGDCVGWGLLVHAGMSVSGCLWVAATGMQENKGKTVTQPWRHLQAVQA